MKAAMLAGVVLAWAALVIVRRRKKQRVDKADSAAHTTHNRTLDVVVAHYRDKTFEQLVPSLGADAVFVYDKSECGLTGGPAEHVVRRVPNTGRESETYLRHIVEHYETLADFTVFIQDDTHVHVPPRHEAYFRQQLEDAMQVPGGPGRVLQVSWRGKRLQAPRRIDSRVKLFPKIQSACRRFGIAMPSEYDTHVCAFLVLSRDTIRRRPKAFFQALQAWHVESVPRRQGSTEAQLAPWILEHTWQIIFFGKD